MEENDQLARFSKEPTTVELRVMYFIEHTAMVVRKHPILNSIITVIFFLCLYLNTIISHLVKEKESNINSIVNDVLSFITSFNFVNANIDEVKVSLIFVTIVVFVFFFVSVLAFSLSIAYRHILIHIFQIIVIYMIPPFFVIFVSVFQHSYMTLGNPWSAASYFGIFGHSLFIFLVAMTSLFACISPYICIHPFFQRNFSSASVSLFFIIIISHLDCYFFKLNEAMRITRIIVCFLMCIFILVYIPYYNRIVNSAFFSFALFNFLTSLTVKIWPTKQLFCLWYIPISFLITGIIFYIIFPLYYKKWFQEKVIFFEFFFGKYDKVRVLLDQIQNPSEIDSRFFLNITTIAFHFDSPKLPALLHHYFSGQNLYVGELIHMWIISHMYGTAHRAPTPIFNAIIDSNESKISKLEKDFWYNVWLSDITSLPIVSSTLGRKMMNLDLMLHHRNYLLQEVFPSLNDPVEYKVKISMDDFDKEFKVHEVQSFKHIVKRYFGFQEVIIAISVVLYAIYMIASQIYLTKFTHQQQSFKDLLNFTEEFYLFHLNNGIDRSIMYEKFNKAVTTKLKQIQKFYIDTGFVTSFQIYYEALQQTTSYNDFPSELFRNFIDAYENMFSKFLNAFQPFIDSTRKSLKQWNISFYVILSCLSIIPPIISICLLNRKMVNTFEKFRFIPKSEVLKISKIEPKLSRFEKHYISRNFSIFRSYPLTFCILAVYFAFSIMIILITYNCSIFGRDSLDQSEISLYIISNAQRIPIGLSLIIFYDPNEAVNSVQRLVNRFLSDKRLYKLISKYPQSFYDLIGEIVFNKNSNSNLQSIVNQTRSVVDQICSLIKNEVKLEPFSAVYQYQRVSFYIVGLVLFTMTVIYTVLRIAPISYCERNMGQFLYKKVMNNLISSERPNIDSNLDSESNYLSEGNSSELEDVDLINNSESTVYEYKEVDLEQKFSIDNIPLIIIVVDDEFKLIYQTNLAKQATGISNGEKFKQSNLDKSVLYDIKKAFKKFKKERGSSISIPFQYQQSLVISPFYKREKILDYIMIVSSNEPPNASIETFNKLNYAFYSVYPKILPLNQTFPHEIQSNGRPFFILFFKLIGFNIWSDKVDIRIAERFRKDVSKTFESLLQNEVNFCRLRETSDVIVLMMNRETKLSIWKILEVCSDFGNNALELIHKLTDDYQANEIRCCVLLFKVKEPNYYFTDKKCGRSDFKGDSVFAGQERLMNCKPEIVNYTSQKKELKVSNTTKLKSCHTSNGEEYELLIVV